MNEPTTDLTLLRAEISNLRADMHKELHSETWKLIWLTLPIYVLIIALLLITLIEHIK
jgi:hypothetical protein